MLNFLMVAAWPRSPAGLLDGLMCNVLLQLHVQTSRVQSSGTVSSHFRFRP